MTKSFYFLSLTITLISLITSCRLTRTDVIGKWKGQFGDTLIINKNNSFLFIKNKSISVNLTDTLQTHLVGQWDLQKKSIYFIFSDTIQNFGGDCKSFQYWWTRGSKKKLIRPMTCINPTHHFITITKID